MRNFNTVSLVFSCVILLSACGSTAKLNDDVATDKNHTPPEPPRPCCVNPRTPDPLDDPNNILSKRSIYFDYDDYAIKDEFKALIEAHGKYLLSRKSRKVIIEGNSDERGGREYNLALGQRRAEAVRKRLLMYGVPESQIEAISFGAEKPKAEGHNEAAWTENRRSDLAYQ